MSKIEPVGHAVNMPACNGGFTMFAWKASDVPLGTPLYIEDPKQAERIRGLEATLQDIINVTNDFGAYTSSEDIAKEIEFLASFSLANQS